MWKLVIADDERIIVKGLKKLIDWEALNIEIAGEAYNGEQLKKLIEYADPDIVLTDIMMPYMTGLELISWYKEQKGKAKFIFVSGYQEFSYAQEAIKNGAVDYLLKPVGADELTEAVTKAIRQIEEQNTAEIFQEKKDEFQKLFEHLNDGRNYENEDLYQIFRAENFDYRDCFFVGICAGICPDEAAKLSEASFAHFNLTRFSVFNRLMGAFAERKLGFVVKKDENAQHMIGVFPQKDRACYIEKYVDPIRRQIEEDCGVGICMGIGTPTVQPAEIFPSYQAAKVAFGLYHFEEKRLIEIGSIHRNYEVSFEDYKESLEQAFRAILTKSPDALDRIDQVMEQIEAIHYGNWQAVIMRTMNFTGELGIRLNQYRLLPEDFYEMQDKLQAEVEAQYTMSALRNCIHRHYEDLTSRIYEKGRTQDKILIEDVKNYIRTHYARDLSIRELAEVACVSQNYFSAMFKKETGQNYKAFLTDIRMEKALSLLETTDDKTYEIGEAVGYNNVRRFVDTFKQRFGVSPMEYRKAKRREENSF